MLYYLELNPLYKNTQKVTEKNSVRPGIEPMTSSVLAWLVNHQAMVA